MSGRCSDCNGAGKNMIMGDYHTCGNCGGTGSTEGQGHWQRVEDNIEGYSKWEVWKNKKTGQTNTMEYDLPY